MSMFLQMFIRERMSQTPSQVIMVVNDLKIGTWNLCLGLPNKKDIVTNYLNDNKIDLCCLQETEVQMGFPEKILNCNGYNLELELNVEKKRVGIYITSSLNYIRRQELEKTGFHVVIVDVICIPPIRIINVYRSFRPSGISPNKFFETQLEIVKNALTSNCYVMGDFNLDARMEGVDPYNYKYLTACY